MTLRGDTKLQNGGYQLAVRGNTLDNDNIILIGREISKIL